MFQAKQLVFYTCVSPVHMGAGQAVGAIDNPIQREVHTGHPLIAGSGLKGAVRHHFARTWADKDLIKRIFGPDRDASEHAGAIAFTDAALVAFPVRSLRNTFVYATCPTALARLKRLAGDQAAWSVPQVGVGSVKSASSGPGSAVVNDRLILEAFDFAATEDPAVKAIATWLATHALPPGDEHTFFRDKLKADLMVLSDTEFDHFVHHATVVEAHVRIDDDTGTAAKGALFYTENLPPESLLAGLVLASVERTKAKDANDLKDARWILDTVLQDGTGEEQARHGLADRLLQVGGDATTGRGLIVVHITGKVA
jgi:CRISPR-associated protein Cmr4